MEVTLDGRRADHHRFDLSDSNIGCVIAKRLGLAGASVVVNGRTAWDPCRCSQACRRPTFKHERVYRRPAHLRSDAAAVTFRYIGDPLFLEPSPYPPLDKAVPNSGSEVVPRHPAMGIASAGHCAPYGPRRRAARGRLDHFGRQPVRGGLHPWRCGVRRVRRPGTTRRSCVDAGARCAARVGNPSRSAGPAPSLGSPVPGPMSGYWPWRCTSRRART
jgi:hypothetical protein